MNDSGKPLHKYYLISSTYRELFKRQTGTWITGKRYERKQQSWKSHLSHQSWDTAVWKAPLGRCHVGPFLPSQAEGELVQDSGRTGERNERPEPGWGVKEARVRGLWMSLTVICVPALFNYRQTYKTLTTRITYLTYQAPKDPLFFRVWPTRNRTQ